MPRVANREQRIVIRWRGRGRAERLRASLNQAYPVDEDPCFDKVLKAIDDAERQVWGDRGSDDDGIA